MEDQVELAIDLERDQQLNGSSSVPKLVMDEHDLFPEKNSHD
jgi:hypothetical protein